MKSFITKNLALQYKENIPLKIVIKIGSQVGKFTGYKTQYLPVLR